MEQQFQDLPLAYKKWLSILLWKLIISDGWVTKEECPFLQEAMNWVTYDEFYATHDNAEEKGIICNLEAPKGLTFETAFVMLNFLLVVAPADQKLALSELTLIEKAACLLGFSEQSVEKLLGFVNDVNEKAPALSSHRSWLQAEFKVST